MCEIENAITPISFRRLGHKYRIVFMNDQKPNGATVVDKKVPVPFAFCIF